LSRNSWARGTAHDRGSAVYGEALVGLGQNAKAIAVLAPAIDAALSDGDLRTLITALR